MDKRKYSKNSASRGHFQRAKGPYEQQRVKQDPLEGGSTFSGPHSYSRSARSRPHENDTKDKTLQPDVSGGPSKERHNASPLVRMIVTDLQPLSIIEGTGFREFMRALNPSHSIPKGISTLRSELLQLYESVKKEVKASLYSVHDVVLTSATWTRGTKSYQTVSCHFISHNWELKSYVLETKVLTDRNTGIEIVNQLQTISKEWEITEKVHAVVMNGPNVLRARSGWTYFPCFAHTLDLVFKDVLKGDPAYEALLEKCRQVVQFLHCNATGKLKDSLPPYELMLSEETRWNSTFYMLEKLSQQHNAINNMLSHSGEKSLRLNDHELSKIRNIVSALQLFEEAVNDMSQQKYVSVSWIIPVAKLLKETLGMLARNGNKVAEQLAENFAKRVTDIEDNYKLAASTALDARFKVTLQSADGSTDQNKIKLLLNEILNPGKAGQSARANLVSPSNCPVRLWKLPECEEELRRYATKKKIPREGNPLSWWKVNGEEFPILQRAAGRYLGIVSTCAPTVRAFSRAGEVYSLQRLRLELETISVMLFLNGNYIFSKSN
ncbi:zinc finger BED domain-containing protein 4-like isoform X2 [Anguilla anguilla]|uniref:zinc finger BED domain-containing protein 4-like isoform X2 n=1 Tax=Anguilla anguilla TaxID=7936 RepID=UPI0015A76B69|nr:zinc finger BED domain-containing protein 4-like isoform X2 [Anguilla anguilla]XP_035263236.1 zinc finger BED domain-containing protein 4-like isoform X2 [Anguilla anguilla]